MQLIVRVAIRLLLLAAGLMLPLAAQAHSQVRNAAACSNVAVGGNPNWGTPTNAQVNDGTRTASNINDNQTTDTLRCLQYNFAIPVGATILGIVVHVERRLSAVVASPVQDALVQVIKGGVVQAPNRLTTMPYTAADFIEAHGVGTTDLWGTTWTVAEINAANFGADFAAFKNGTGGGATNVQVDQVQIEVFYNRAPPAPTLASPANGATVLTPQPLFSWNAVVEPDGDTVTYDLQVDDTDCTFASPEIDQTGITGTSFTSSTALFEGTHCWRVRAIDEHGLAGAWSATRNVIINAPATLSQTASPASCISVNLGNPNWNNPARAETDNASYATSTVGDNQATDALVCTQYGFIIPTGATIAGIVISVERRTNDVTMISPTRDNLVVAIKNGAAAPSNLPSMTDYTLADEVEPHGSASELWGTTWTPADINAIDFGAAFQAWKAGTVGGNVTISVDHISITVHYSNPAATPSVFTAFETGTAGGATSGVIQTKVAGVAFSTDVVAILSGAQHSTFTTTALVDLVSNNTFGGPLDGQNCPTALTAISTAANLLITGGRTTMNFAAVPNSWRDVRVRVRFPANAPTVTACSNDNFAIRPASFTVAATDATWQTAGTARALTNAAASGGVVHAAGRPFTLTLTVSPATATSYATDPTATAATTLPAGGANGTLSAGAFSTGSSTRTSTSATYSEAGVFNLTLLDDTFAQVDLSDGTPATCAGRQICQSNVPLAVGRFVPNHFDFVAGTSPIFRTFDTTNGTCSTPTRTFTYVGQPFGYETAPTATVRARSFAGTITTNYRGALWKIAPADVAQGFSNPGKAIVPALGAPTLAEIANTGTGSLSTNAADKISFARTGVEDPFNANISLTWSVSDGTELAGHVDNGSIATTTPLVFSSTFDAGATIRFGRLRLANANGSQLLPLPVRMEAQYYASVALGFVTNADDHCTSIANTDIAMTFTGNLAPAPTNCKTALGAGGPLASGRRTFMLSAPGSGNDGAAELTVNLGAASGTTCTTVGAAPTGTSGAGRSYLRGNWTAAPYTEDPKARATFGAFKGAGEVIFIRENF